MSEPTAGQWRIGDIELGEIKSDKGELLATAYPMQSDKGKPASETERQANLYLMLAAKEMYAVCEMAAQYTYPRGHRSKMTIAARVALRKFSKGGVA